MGTIRLLQLVATNDDVVVNDNHSAVQQHKLTSWSHA